MSSVVISGDTSGAITVAAPAVAGTNTLTLPATTGTLAINGPAFSVYPSASQSLGNTVWTKVQNNTKVFDTANAFDSSTNYRFQPLVAGYYQVNAVGTSNTAITFITGIYKNGSAVCVGTIAAPSTSNGNSSSSAVSLIYLNGSTDYIEQYVISIGNTTTTANSSLNTYFQASMVRSA